MAANSGAMDQARAEWATEAQALADFADKFPSSDWSVSFRFNAAKYFFYASQPAKAVEQADKVLLNPNANDTSRAMAAKLAHAAITPGRAGQGAGRAARVPCGSPSGSSASRCRSTRARLRGSGSRWSSTPTPT